VESSKKTNQTVFSWNKELRKSNMYEQEVEDIILALKACGINMLAIDFDQTFVTEHTKGAVSLEFQRFCYSWIILIHLVPWRI
jgi:hypothetical protein